MLIGTKGDTFVETLYALFVVIFVSGVRIFAGVGWDAAATVVSVPVEDFNRPSSGIAAVLVADASAD